MTSSCLHYNYAFHLFPFPSSFLVYMLIFLSALLDQSRRYRKRGRTDGVKRKTIVALKISVRIHLFPFVLLSNVQLLCDKTCETEVGIRNSKSHGDTCMINLKSFTCYIWSSRRFAALVTICTLPGFLAQIKCD